MSEETNQHTIPFKEPFASSISVDTRSGYEGYIVPNAMLTAFATYIRDELGYDYLSSVTGVDYYPEDKMEAVYHAFRSTGGGALVFKAQTSRNNSEIPSLTHIYPGVEFQEREIWDLFGIKFSEHPDLRRILLWEGFNGYPLRKDWHEPFFEEELKPYANRWPEGKASRIENHNPYKNNVAYPPNFNPYEWTEDSDEALYKTLKKVEHESDAEHIGTEQILVNFGPQHPSTHGVFRMVASLDGETIVDLKPVMGYLHRNHEKIGERNTFLMNMPFTDRLDYLSSMSNNFGYALAVEKLLKIQVPERAEYLRVMMAEFTRISNHLMAVGALLNDLGAYFTPMLYALEERELILDIFEAVSGSRMMCNYFRFGGVARDLPEGVLEKIKALAFDRLPRSIDELDTYLTENEIVRYRCEGVGVLTAEQAIAYSTSGPVLRASGVPYDIRRADPYSIYDRFDFDVAVGYHGDVYDRYLVRIEEMRQSVKIIQQAVKQLPEGAIMQGAPKYQIKVPAGEAYGRVEAPKGELGYYIVSNGKANPWRYHVRAPSFINLTALAPMCINAKVADAIIILGAIDIVLGETDR